VSGNIRVENLKTKKVKSDHKITKLRSKDTQHFGTQLPPLKVPRELLEPRH
jgi:hypothetical protein